MIQNKKIEFKNKMMGAHQTYVKKHGVSVGITIVLVNSIESLRELYVADGPSKIWVHEEAHGLPQGLAIVNVVITVEIQ